MKVIVQLQRIDLLENDSKIIAKGNAILENNTLKYKELEEDAIHIVKFDKECIILERKCEVASCTTLYPLKQGKTIVQSIYGDMEMDTKTHSYSKDEQIWSVEYSIYTNGEEISRQKLIWTIQYRN